MDQHITFKPSNVCCTQIDIIFDENKIIKEVTFLHGCQGNTTGVSKLLVGMTLEEAYKRLHGIACRGSRTKLTSCPDQLSLAIEPYL
ncbi:MAG: TIGR03905 family TSCPD domain-containing protein [Bacilli bacterium]|nr:TIGR03905 family TSCPD domain-containing protein [Bacilli bacterium]